MGFMQQFESDLRDLLSIGEPLDDVVKWTKEALYESFKNGVKEGQKGGKNRRYEKKWSGK